MAARAAAPLWSRAHQVIIFTSGREKAEGVQGIPGVDGGVIGVRLEVDGSVQAERSGHGQRLRSSSMPRPPTSLHSLIEEAREAVGQPKLVDVRVALLAEEHELFARRQRLEPRQVARDVLAGKEEEAGLGGSKDLEDA